MKYASILLLGTLIACGKTDPTSIGSRPIEIDKSPEFSNLGLIGYQPLTFRAQFDKKGDEIKDAYCELSGSGFKASFLTPAIVMIPNFGERNQDLVTFCRYHGETISQIQHSQKKSGVNLSEIASGVGGMAAGPIGGLVAGTATGLVTKKPTSDYGYENTTVIFPAEK